MVNLSSVWRDSSMEAAALYTYFRTGKWDAPPGLSGASIPRAENVNTLDLSDPALSHRLVSPTNLTFPFSPFSITSLLQAFNFSCSAFSSFLCPTPPLFLSLFQMGARQSLTLLYSCVSEAAWVATKVKRGVGRWLLISTRNQMSLALTKAGFWSSNSCLYRERQDFFPDIASRKEGEDGRLCTTKEEDRMWTFRRSLRKGCGEEKRLPCLAWRFAHGRHWRGWGQPSKECSRTLLEVAEICQMILAPLFGARLAPGTKCILIRVTFLIPLQSTHQHPRSSNVSPNPQKVIWVSPELSDFKREKLLLDKIQQLSSNSWEGPVASIKWGPRESRNRWAGNKKKSTNESGKLSAWGWLRRILSRIRISSEKDNRLHLSKAIFCFCLFVCFSWANTTGRRVRIKRLKGWVSVKIKHLLPVITDSRQRDLGF